MRILVVDKLASFRKKVRGWLADGGHASENVLEAGNGHAAMELLRREEFNVDAIVCEWEQATVGASDLIQQLRAVPGFAHIGFIAVGPPTPAQEKAAKSCGATQYMPQPVDPEMLLQALVEIEKKAIANRKRAPSPTTRFRILANEPPARVQLPAAAMGAAESELRKGAKSAYLKPGGTMELHAGAPLHWIESGSVMVSEIRADGIELEYRLGPGQFLAEATFGGFPFTALTLRAEGEVWLSTQVAATVDDLRKRHPVLFYSFRNIATERARRFQKADDRKAVERGLAGEVESLPVGDLMGILHGARKTGVLRLQTPDRTYYIQFTAGSIRHAEANGELGEEVFYEALLQSKGRFEFMVGPEVEGPVTIAKDTPSLLLEGLKRRAARVSKEPRVSQDRAGE
ncbi:MAG: DUF4388 domain-containing protein [Planctomycetota bacterium]